MHDTEEASKYKDIGGSARNTILALVQRTHPLIIGNSLSSQESHEQPCIPRRVYEGFGYPCTSRPILREGLLTEPTQMWIHSED